jgi:hypothetical protein
MNSHSVFIGTLLLTAATAAGAATATGFGSASWGTTDTTPGVAGYAIEDFEDVTLVPGLQVQVVPPSSPGYGPASVLPFTFDPATDDVAGCAFVTGVWGGSRAQAADDDRIAYDRLAFQPVRCRQRSGCLLRRSVPWVCEDGTRSDVRPFGSGIRRLAPPARGSRPR